MPIDMNTRQPGQDIGQDASIMDFLRAMGQDAGAVGSKIGGMFTGGGQPVAAKGIQADPAAVANKSMRPQMQTPPVGASVPSPTPVNSAELPSIKPPTAAPPLQGTATPPNVRPNPARPQMPSAPSGAPGMDKVRGDISKLLSALTIGTPRSYGPQDFAAEKARLDQQKQQRMSPLLEAFRKMIGMQSGQ